MDRHFTPDDKMLQPEGIWLMDKRLMGRASCLVMIDLCRLIAKQEQKQTKRRSRRKKRKRRKGAHSCRVTISASSLCLFIYRQSEEEKKQREGKLDCSCNVKTAAPVQVVPDLWGPQGGDRCGGQFY